MKLNTQQAVERRASNVEGRNPVRLSTLAARPSAFGSQRGVALVITLILLSVTLFMAVAFLAISRRERGSVLTETDTVTARLAADSGLANAEAQILATVLQATNPYNFNLVVSTNYQNNQGYFIGSQNPTNVNYDFRNVDGQPLNANDYLQNVANLFYLPRAPVFAYDRNANTNEFRFYLDLNRNIRFDPNGLVPNVDNLGFTNNFISEVGDPEWIGVLERPDAPHGPNNKFLSRYAFIALPAGNTLDLNYIHNAAASRNANTVAGGSDGFYRNQGVGSWEINLAAFLADLNTNEWGQTIGTALNGNSTYYYYQYAVKDNRGRAFDDARALLAYRYDHNYNTLATVRNLFGVTGGNVFPNDAIDGYSDGSLQTTVNTNADFIPDDATLPWAGADNTNHYFSLSADLFDTTKITAPSLNFVDHLFRATTNTYGGSTVPTYNRYTFYRLLAQLGTDSAPEADKLNVNYVNVDASGNIVPDRQTNLITWEPGQFFTNAADRLLRAYTTRWFQSGPSNYLATYYGIRTNYYYADGYGIHTNDISGIGLTNVPFFGMTNQIPAFGVTEIPVWINSNFVYRSAVQRVLQLAANIYDATTNSTADLGRDYPSVFRPLFGKNTAGDIFIINYASVDSVGSASDFRLSIPFDAAIIAALPGTTVPANDNIYGVPWILGAKKGFPSFNEISMQNVVKISRKLQVVKSNPTTYVATNEQYSFGINNSIGIEFWNSYTNTYSSPLQVVVNNFLTMNLTNAYSVPYWGSYNLSIPPSILPTWQGYAGPNAANSFYVPLQTNVVFMTNMVYQPGFGFKPESAAAWQPVQTFPHFGLFTTNRLQAFILAVDSGGKIHVVDYVHFSGPDSYRDLNREIQTRGTLATYDNMWNTNLTRGWPLGVVSQWEASRGALGYVKDYWANKDLAYAEMDGFSVALDQTPLLLPFPTSYTNEYLAIATNLVVQAPYTPTVTATEYTSWQANDPLVHYLSGDLNFSSVGGATPTGTNTVYKDVSAIKLPNIGEVNDRYQPWGVTYSYTDSDRNPFNTACRDPLVQQSDDWNFPTFKLPSVGWLGRVHRGTPWQTVYLKATNVVTASGLATWTNWTGNSSRFDATNSAPVQDRLLFDVFSTALNANATRGQLPVNVAAGNPANPAAGLAAWSAVFSGLLVPTNRTGNYTIIEPAGVAVFNSPLYALVTNVNYMRQFFTNTTSQGGSFKRVGDILSVSKLTQTSPFLLGQTNVTDALMEWLPQQTMSLLRIGSQPRFVIYSYGQTLKPAPNGVVNNGNYSGMITNYQVVAETVTRAVVRIEGAPTNAHAVVESYNVLPPD